MGRVVKDLGAATAYAYAVEKGYTGTEDEFAELMASYADVAEQAADSAAQAGASATAAEQAKAEAVLSASAAASSASTASTKASEAASSASSAAGSANTATTKANEASTSATNAASSASAAATSATNAGASATAAASSATAASNAQTAAETAQGKAEDAQTAAEDAAASVSASAAQITQNTEDIADLRSAFDEVETAIGTETAISDVSINPVRGHRYYYSNGEFKDVSDVGNTYYSDVLNVSAGQKYYYSGRVYNYSNQYSVIVTDNNSNVLLYELGNTTDTNVVDYPFTIPDNGTKLYITSYRKVSDASSSDLALKQETTNLFQISRITDEIGGVIPQYYYENDWLQSRIDDVADHSGFMNGVVFPFITDIHFHSNAGNSKYLLKKILEKTSASFVVGGGDYQGGFGGADELQDQFNAFFEFAGYVGHDRFFPIAGNHDFYEATSASADASTWVKATYGEVYNAIYRPYERWQINRMPGGYCCIDNDAQKTRFILLNSHEVSPVASSTYVDGLIRVRHQQIQWLISALKEKTDYKIIVFSHVTSDPSMPDYSYTMANVQNVLEAFANKESATIQFTESWSVTADFTATTNELICHINGHSHVDASHVSNGVLSICTTCDACLQDDGYGATKGTVTEQAFDVFCIDYDAKTINAVRFGRGSNRSWTY